MTEKDYMNLAYIEANKSVCLRAKIGCVIVKDGKVISSGYNTVEGGIDECLEKGCIRDRMCIPHGERREMCLSICAEAVAITTAAKNAINLNNAVIYVTAFPCYLCSKMLVTSGIKKIYYDKDYGDEMSKDYLNKMKIEYIKLEK